MPSKIQHAEHQKRTNSPLAPPSVVLEPAVVLEPSIALEMASAPHPVSRISAARAAVQQFLSTELGGREIRITRIAPLDHGSEGWSADAEILVPNLEVKMLNLPLTQEVFELEQYTVELEADLSVRSYGLLGADEG
jgi:citrate lyase beta subunit